MEITHFCNAFVSVKINKTVIACDPWVGAASDMSWISYPIHQNGAKIINKLKPKFIYVSHLHCDHFEPKILSKYKDKSIKILIKNYSDQILKKRLYNIGFNNIIECHPWKKIKLNKDISIAIIPQITSNTNDIPEQINYDLDTSIVIQSNITKEVFFNGVDNPLTLSDYRKVKKFITRKFNKKISATTLQVGAASDYPQCFLNINRSSEKKKVIKKSLTNLNLKLKILQPDIHFSISGGYILSGKFSALNQYVASPTYYQSLKYIKQKKCKILNIQGGNSVILKKNVCYLNKGKFLKDKLNQKKIIKKYSSKKYFYSGDFKKINLEDIDDAFNKSYENYIKKLNSLPIKTDWDVEFIIYKNLLINSKGKIDYNNSKLLKRYFIKYSSFKTKIIKKNYSKLKCHLDYNLFYGLLKRKYKNWNQPASGSLILYERKPNKFDPNLFMSLNYLAS
tara:strand:- start:14212 stop:15564 length:1353 start_codon:yes stop_codon:yes gene_type:complete